MLAAWRRLAAEPPLLITVLAVFALLGLFVIYPILKVVEVSLVQPDDSIIIGAPNDNPLYDAGYKILAEIGQVAETDIGAITYIPIERDSEGRTLSSSSQLLIALIKPPAQINAELPFFGQVVEGVDVLPQLTTDDTILSITIESE